MEDLKEVLPQSKVEMLVEYIDFGANAGLSKREPLELEATNGTSAKQETDQITLKAEMQDSSDPTVITLKDRGRVMKVRKGMTLEEERKLMQLILDCGGILKTIVTTHDINLKSNVFLRDFFGLTFDYKKECHDISNALVSLSSKIKSIH